MQVTTEKGKKPGKDKNDRKHKKQKKEKPEQTWLVAKPLPFFNFLIYKIYIIIVTFLQRYYYNIYYINKNLIYYN